RRGLGRRGLLPGRWLLSRRWLLTSRLGKRCSGREHHREGENTCHERTHPNLLLGRNSESPLYNKSHENSHDFIGHQHAFAGQPEDGTLAHEPPRVYERSQLVPVPGPDVHTVSCRKTLEVNSLREPQPGEQGLGSSV